MYIVPYYVTQVTKLDRQIFTVHILTEGGTRLWSEAERPLSDILEPNELVTTSSKQIRPDLWLCQIDLNKTNINAMYQWHELPVTSDTHCWRQFYYITMGSPFMTVPDSEMLGPISVKTLLSHILKGDYVVSIDDGIPAKTQSDGKAAC
jgi:hypothetical protein